jgi:hypothetical protein
VPVVADLAAGVERGAPQRKKSLLIGLLSILAVVTLIAVRFFFWPETPEPESQPQPTAQSAPSTAAPPAPSSAQPAPPTKQPLSMGGTAAAGGTTGGPAKASSPLASPKAAPAPAITIQPKTATKATLILDVRHNFKAASISVVAGTSLVYQGLLQEKQKKILVPFQIPAGERVIRVRVQSEIPKFDQEREVGGTFPEGMARSLIVEFGRGSGAGFTERRLILKLGEVTAAPAKKP